MRIFENSTNRNDLTNINPAAPSGTTTLLRLISLTKNESDGRCVCIPEPFIIITIYKPLQPNPIPY